MLQRPQFSLHQYLERLPLYACLPSRQSPRSFSWTSQSYVSRKFLYQVRLGRRRYHCGLPLYPIIPPSDHFRESNSAWTLIRQPLLPECARKLVRATRTPSACMSMAQLVIMIFTASWTEGRNDDFIQKLMRHAATHQTGHRIRHLNYCAKWQQPFAGHNNENWRFLQEISRIKDDPDRLKVWDLSTKYSWVKERNCEIGHGVTG